MKPLLLPAFLAAAAIGVTGAPANAGAVMASPACAERAMAAAGDVERALDVVRAKYAGAGTYYDTGTASVVIESANGTITSRMRFTTAFRRGGGFRWTGDVDWSASSLPGLTQSQRCEVCGGGGEGSNSEAELSTFGMAVMGLGLLNGGGLELARGASVDRRELGGEGCWLLHGVERDRRVAVLVGADGRVLAHECVRTLEGATVRTSVRFEPRFDESLPEFLLEA